MSKSECVRKADVDEEEKGTGIQGLKDVLAETEGEEAEELREEIEESEERTLRTERVSVGRSFHTSAGGWRTAPGTARLRLN